MSVQVHGGAVRLDDAGLAALLDGEPHPGVTDLPGVREALDAVRRPVARLGLDVAGVRGVQTHQAWVAPEAVALLLAVSGEERQLMALPPTGLAAALARVTRIGPRRVALDRAPVEVDPQVLGDLLADEEVLRSSACTALAVDADRAWHLELAWETGSHALAVVDGPDGLWRVEVHDGGATLHPTTASVLWRLLSTLLLPVDA